MPERVSSVAAVAPVSSGPANGGALSLGAPQQAGSSEPPIDFEQAVTALSEHFGSQEPPLLFHTARDDGDLVVKVVDPRDNKVVRQIPSAEVLRLARSLQQGSPSLMAKQKA
jgi:flagellar protein FlaG